MASPNPRFTGIFIPVEILEMESINTFDKMVLAWVDALYCKEHQGCFASNEYLANRLKVETNTIAKVLTKLRKLNLIEDVSFDGRKRVIRSLMYKVVNEAQRNAALDKNPIAIGQKSNPELDICPSSPYIYSKVENKEDKSEPPFGRVASYFYEKLKKINPKVKKPNLEKWAREFQLLAKDGNTEQDIQKTIDYVVSTYENPTSNGFCWANVILSPQALRKNFPKIWGEMQTKKNPIDTIENNRKLANAIIRKFKKNDIIIGFDYLEFINGQYANHIKFDEKNFKEKCFEELRKRNLNIEEL